MKSKKNIWNYRAGQKTYKSFKIPKELKRYCTKAQRQAVNKINNKRARTLNYFVVFDFEIP